MEQNYINLNDLLNVENPTELLAQAESFIDMMMKYSCAIKEIRTKFEVLSEEFNVRYKRNPVESIKTRMKKPISIIEKMKRKGLPVTVDNIRKNLNDIAGIRIICSYIDDIYALADMLARQDDIVVLDIKDYITHPKSNGYRSLHMIIEIPIFLSDKKELVNAEIQIRTIAMDFWASLDHQLRYKQHIDNESDIVEQLRQCSESISAMDLKMQDIRKQIERH